MELYVLGLLDKKEGCVCNCLLINMNIEYCINILYKIYIKNIFINNMWFDILCIVYMLVFGIIYKLVLIFLGLLKDLVLF